MDTASETGGADSTTVAKSDGTRSRLLVSIFTPSWSLSLILLVCIFLPGFEGCNGSKVAIYQVGTSQPSEWYVNIIVFFPQLFAVGVIAGTFILCANDPPLARWMWQIYAGVIGFHTMFLLIQVAIYRNEFFSQSPDKGDFLFLGTWLVYSAALVVILIVATLRSKSWFNAAMWLQIVLAGTALLIASFIVPAAALAQKILIGGKLNVIASAGLLFVSVIQQMDGQRVLNRKPGASPIQLDLRMMFILMTVGGILFAWVCSFCFVPIPEKQQPGKSDQPKTVLLERPGIS